MKFRQNEFDLHPGDTLFVYILTESQKKLMLLHKFAVKKCFTHCNITLSEMLDVQTDKVRKKQDITPLCNPEDFFSQAKSLAGYKVGFELAEKVDSALRLGAACTADHHGGIYCA